MTEHKEAESSGEPTFDRMLDVVLGGTAVSSIAKRIRERDYKLKSCAHAQWLENGRDLLEAKRILGHGKFEDWCKRELQYSTRTAQKLMRAAEVFEPLIENEPNSDLPLPTAVYAVSAPSVPREIREAYAPRIVAGERVLAELRTAIKLHRDQANSTKPKFVSRDAKSLEAQGPQGRGVAGVNHKPRDAEQHTAEQVRQAAARSEAVALIKASFGDSLPDLMALVAEAGSDSIFSLDTERELLKQMHPSAAPPVNAETACDADQAVAPADNLLSPNKGDALSSPTTAMVDEFHVEQAPAAELSSAPASALPGTQDDPPDAVTTNSFFGREPWPKFKHSRDLALNQRKPPAPL